LSCIVPIHRRPRRIDLALINTVTGPIRFKLAQRLKLCRWKFNLRDRVAQSHHRAVSLAQHDEGRKIRRRPTRKRKRVQNQPKHRAAGNVDPEERAGPIVPDWSFANSVADIDRSDDSGLHH
jgi:hypothetical protein